MGFFKKLKERLFKSSSKIDEGLDAIIEDGGEAEEVELEEDLKTQEEIVDYAKNDQTDIKPVLIDSQLEQNAPTRSEPTKTEEKKETDDLDTSDHVEYKDGSVSTYSSLWYSEKDIKRMVLEKIENKENYVNKI